MTTVESTTLDQSLYDFRMGHADGAEDFLEQFKGKVTLFANCAAGCGNITQHEVLQEIHESFPDEDFNVVIVVVDDFPKHNLPEYGEGLEAFACKLKEETGEELTPGQVAERYGREEFGVTYQFSELTNARYDKDWRMYDPTWARGSVREQEPHPFWFKITEGDKISLEPNGLPHHWETNDWSDDPEIKLVDNSKPGWRPVPGHMEKFLVDRTGTVVRRYHNGFLSGEIDEHGAYVDIVDPDTEIPFVKEQPDGTRYDVPRGMHDVDLMPPEKWKHYKETYLGGQKVWSGGWPTPTQAAMIAKQRDDLLEDITALV
jgi:glutathione peroxidase-family protein